MIGMGLSDPHAAIGIFVQWSPKIGPPLFWMKFLQRILFSPPIYATVHMLSKKHGTSSTLHKEGLTNKGIHKQVHDKRGICFWPVHAYINRARLTVCEVGLFSRGISQLSKIPTPPSLRSHWSSLPMGVFSGTPDRGPGTQGPKD